ncbi:hypothetical protein [Candidatus Tisiphia endosymbiont of Stenodema calcarata]|uniref:hypothetical protein n=1 Tax=Candidatus Tisiphia endosymbiont of Stenodema calcarata TaxID=3139337 RepID=UPI003CCA8510
MFGFLEVGREIQILYEYAKAEILESDFFDLQSKFSFQFRINEINPKLRLLRLL